jgi:hypothetical protein
MDVYEQSYLYKTLGAEECNMSFKTPQNCL